MPRILLILLFPLFSFAQLPTNSIAPDFDIIDIDGESHRLYDYLDQGKFVILEFFGARCAPCWSFHETHLLEDLYQEYGPEGSDELMIIAIEVEKYTGLEELMGGNGAVGDFVTGISYPVVNDEAGPESEFIVSKTAQLYGLNFTPNLYVVCPNRLLTLHRVVDLDAEKIFKTSDSCISQTVGNDAYLLDVKGMNPTCEDAYNQVQCIFYNNGSTLIEDLSIEVYKNQELQYSESWTGSMSTYEYDTIDLSAFSAHGNELTNYEIKLGWTKDDNQGNNEVIFDINPIIAESKINFQIEKEILTSWQKEEWSMIDQDGNELFRLSSDSLVSGTSIYEVEIPSSVSCLYYQSDAKSFFPDDKITITNADGGQLLIFQDSTGLRDYSEHVLFHSGYSDVQDIDLSPHIKVYPTLTNDIVNIETDGVGECLLEIFSLQGESLLKTSFDGRFHSQSISHLMGGMYVLIVSSQGIMSSHYFYVSD